MKFPALECIRALAALLVLANHVYGNLHGVPQFGAISALTSFATEAVVIFFVLSGAVIELSRERGISSWQGYLYARWLRIYPIYVLAILLALLAWPTLSGHPVLSWHVLAGNLLFLQSLPGYLVPVLASDNPLWSLSYEMSFYLLFVFVIWRPGFRWVWLGLALFSGTLGYWHALPRMPVLAHAVSILSFSSYWLVGNLLVRHRHQLALPGPGRALTYFTIALAWSRVPWGFGFAYYDFLRLGGFALGCGVLVTALIRATEKPETASAGTGRVGPVLCAVPVLAGLWTISAAALATRVLLTLLVAAVLLVPVVSITRPLNVFNRLTPGLVWLGSISYALYVFHFPLVLLVDALAGSMVWPVRMALVLGLVLALAWGAERILQPWLVRRFARPASGTMEVRSTS